MTAAPGPAPLHTGVQRVLAYGAGVSAVVLVEGVSDQRAVESAATRLGRDLMDEGVLVVPMGGVTSIGRFLEAFGPRGLGVRLAGLYDESEAGFVRRGLDLVGMGGGSEATADLASRGFEVCVADLEEELIRALTPAVAEQVIADQGDLTSFRSLQRQPQWRDRPKADQLRRFLGSGSGRKIRYAPLFVEALDPGALPRPLVDLLSCLESSVS